VSISHNGRQTINAEVSVKQAPVVALSSQKFDGNVEGLLISMFAEEAVAA